MTPAILQAEAAGIDFTVHELKGVGAQGFASLGLPLERVYKTLIVEVDGSRLVVAMLSIDSQLDFKRLAAATGAKSAVLAAPREAERSTGYLRGSISPLGQRRRLPTLLDTAALEFATIFV